MKLAIVLALIPTIALAQTVPTSTDYYKQTVSNCVAESANLFEQANKFASEVQTLKAKIADLEKKLGEQPKDDTKSARPTGRPN